MSSPAPRPAFLDLIETKETKLQGVVGPNVYAYGDIRPMNRIRAYSSAGLGPFAGRGSPREFHLLGHVHVDAAGKAARVEGFNGLEGERWAQQAYERLAKENALADNATLQTATPLKLCPHTGFR